MEHLLQNSPPQDMQSLKHLSQNIPSQNLHLSRAIKLPAEEHDLQLWGKVALTKALGGCPSICWGEIRPSKVIMV
jgi:hypothetical protein